MTKERFTQILIEEGLPMRYIDAMWEKRPSFFNEQNDAENESSLRLSTRILALQAITKTIPKPETIH